MAMTAHLFRLGDSVASSVGYCWLAAVAEMAAAASRNWPPPPEPGPLGGMSRPKVATCTPGTDPGSVHAARDFTIATLQRWGATDRREDIAIVVSELLTNALHHALPGPGAPRPRRLGLLQQGPFVLCAVADPSQQPPVPKEPSYLAETGRGLHLISALADTWGYTTPSDTGKVVWAMFSAKPAPPRYAPSRARSWAVDVARLLWHVLSCPLGSTPGGPAEGSNTMQDFTRDTVRANQLTFEYLPQGDGPLALCARGSRLALQLQLSAPALAGAGYRAFAASPLPNNVK